MKRELERRLKQNFGALTVFLMLFGIVISSLIGNVAYVFLFYSGIPIISAFFLSYFLTGILSVGIALTLINNGRSILVEAEKKAIEKERLRELMKELK